MKNNMVELNWLIEAFPNILVFKLIVWDSYDSKGQYGVWDGLRRLQYYLNIERVSFSWESEAAATKAPLTRK